MHPRYRLFVSVALITGVFSPTLGCECDPSVSGHEELRKELHKELHKEPQADAGPDPKLDEGAVSLPTADTHKDAMAPVAGVIADMHAANATEALAAFARVYEHTHVDCDNTDDCPGGMCAFGLGQRNRCAPFADPSNPNKVYSPKTLPGAHLALDAAVRASKRIPTGKSIQRLGPALVAIARAQGPPILHVSDTASRVGPQATRQHYSAKFALVESISGPWPQQFTLTYSIDTALGERATGEDETLIVVGGRVKAEGAFPALKFVFPTPHTIGWVRRVVTSAEAPQ